MGDNMKNAIKYFYNLNVDSIRQTQKDYFLVIDKSLFILYYANDINMDQILAIIAQYKEFDSIIKTVDNKYSINNHGDVYILTKVKSISKKIELNDLLTFTYPVRNNQVRSLSLTQKWCSLWENRVDYVEYQISQMNKKINIISESAPYYIGMTETAIQILKNNTIFENSYYVSHARVKFDDNLIQLFNPINLIIDAKVRDMAEYLKDMFFSSDNNNDFCKLSLEYISMLARDDKILFFARLLYPSYYYDSYDRNIIDGNDNSILNVIKKRLSYEKNIRLIYNFLKNINVIDNIEWLNQC